jgi:hypothetical protein
LGFPLSLSRVSGYGRCGQGSFWRRALSGGGGVIDVPDGHYVLTIAPASPDDDLTGDLNITGNVTIVGDVANPAGVVIDANGQSRVFDVDTGGTADISGVTITKGNPHNDSGFSDFNGGGIEANGPLTLSGSVVTANEIFGGGNGAGIQVNAGALALNSVTVGVGHGSRLSDRHRAGSGASGPGLRAGVARHGGADTSDSAKNGPEVTERAQ